MKEGDDEKEIKHWVEEINEQGNLCLRKNEYSEAKERLCNCYERIIEFNKKYMDLPDETHKIIAMWIIGTYFHNQFSAYPYLFLNAMRGSGKTRQLKIISHLGNLGDGTIQNDMSEAVLFRMKRNKVLCIDEFENVANKEKMVLRQLLNSAYKKGMKVTRMKKVKGKEEKYIEESFEPFLPICMANINGMDEVLGDRSIKIILEKSNNPRIIKKAEDFEENEVILDLKKELSWFSVVLCSVVTYRNIINKWNYYLEDKYNSDIITLTPLTTYNDITTSLNEKELELFNSLDEAGIDGRNFELCFPILIISKELDEDIFKEILKILKEITTEKKQEEFNDSRDISLYDFISQKESLRFNFIPIKQLTQEFRIYLGEQDQGDNWINEKWIGNALSRLKLKVNSRRMTNGRQVILDIDKAKKMIKYFKLSKDDKEDNSQSVTLGDRRD